jgi:uncharacterized membrane protein YczE
MPSLMLGLFLFAVGISLTVKANLGLSPWSVFHMGLAKHLPVTFGQAAQLTGFILILLTFFIKVIPGLATIFNMYLVGLFVDLILESNILPTPNHIILRIIVLFAGLVCIAFASYFYLRVELGAGPRDGLMGGLVRVTNKSVGFIRTAIEVSVLVTGFLLGGPVGIGTVIASLFTGTIVQWAFKIGGYDPSEAKHINLAQMYKVYCK